MKRFSKCKDSPSELGETIRERALKIIDDNISLRFPEIKRFKMIRDELGTAAPAIDSGRATLPDVVAFCNEYGCSADFLLGLDERMYR